jgi:signal transduction histidine kinase
MKTNWQDQEILIVDDETSNLDLLQSILARSGFKNVNCVSDPCLALQAFIEQPPDLVLLDLSMPKLDGFAIMHELQSLLPPDSYLPILVITGDRADATKEKALASGATDFVAKPFNPREIVLRVRILLEARYNHTQLQDAKHRLEDTVQERTRDLVHAMEELKEAQRHVVQQERLRALGTMASGVVHDVNNALSVILGLGEFVMRDCEKLVGMQVSVSRMKSILTAAEDAGRMAERLSYFYRKTPPESEAFLDLNTVIRQTLALTEPRWKSQPMEKGVRVELQLDLQDLPPIIGHCSELRESITNLVFNAIDAMPEGGTLSFATAVDGKDVVLTVGDTGTGMREEVRLRCLEPFFTTKGEKGTGLGLSMVYGIVQRHGGSMDIKTEAGRGTTFTFRFPRDRQMPARALPKPAAPVNGALRILVVEDHEVFRDVVVHALQAESHEVASAANAREAIAQLESHRFDLLLTDHGMPGMNGEQLVSYVRKARPEMRTLLLTSFGRLEDNEPTPEVDLVVSKPLSISKLREAIATAMQPRSTPSAHDNEPVIEYDEPSHAAVEAIR